MPGSCVVDPLNVGIGEPSRGWIVEPVGTPDAEGNTDGGLNASIPDPAFVCQSADCSGAALSVVLLVSGDGKRCVPAFSTGNEANGGSSVASVGIDGSGCTPEPARVIGPMGRKLDLPRSRPGDGYSPDFSEGSEDNSPGLCAGIMGAGRRPEPSGGSANPDELAEAG